MREVAQQGDYCYTNPEFNNVRTASLLHGMSGVGYEMLRYACLDTVLPVL